MDLIAAPPPPPKKKKMADIQWGWVAVGIAAFILLVVLLYLRLRSKPAFVTAKVDASDGYEYAPRYKFPLKASKVIVRDGQTEWTRAFEVQLGRGYWANFEVANTNDGPSVFKFATNLTGQVNVVDNKIQIGENEISNLDIHNDLSVT
jgi:hypothetical protein